VKLVRFDFSAYEGDRARSIDRSADPRYASRNDEPDTPWIGWMTCSAWARCCTTADGRPAGYRIGSARHSPGLAARRRPRDRLSPPALFLGHGVRGGFGAGGRDPDGRAPRRGPATRLARGRCRPHRGRCLFGWKRSGPRGPSSAVKSRRRTRHTDRLTAIIRSAIPCRPLPQERDRRHWRNRRQRRHLVRHRRHRRRPRHRRCRRHRRPPHCQARPSHRWLPRYRRIPRFRTDLLTEASAPRPPSPASVKPGLERECRRQPVPALPPVGGPAGRPDVFSRAAAGSHSSLRTWCTSRPRQRLAPPVGRDRQSRAARDGRPGCPEPVRSHFGSLRPT